MIRVVLAVLLSVALLAVSTTALSHAQDRRANHLAGGTLADLRDAVVDLHRTDAVVGHADDAAKRVLEVEVPAGGIANTRVSYVAIGGVPGRAVPNDTDERDVVAYRLRGGPVRRRWIPVDLRVPARGSRDDGGGGSIVGLAPDSKPLVLREPTRVVLSLLERGGRAVVLARRW